MHRLSHGFLFLFVVSIGQAKEPATAELMTLKAIKDKAPLAGHWVLSIEIPNMGETVTVDDMITGGVLVVHPRLKYEDPVVYDPAKRTITYWNDSMFADYLKRSAGTGFDCTLAQGKLAYHGTIARTPDGKGYLFVPLTKELVRHPPPPGR